MRHSRSTRPRRVVIVAFPGMQSLDAVGPLEVFAGATRVVTAEGAAHSHAGYEVVVASGDGRPVRCGSGLTIDCERLPDGRTPIDTLVLPGGDRALQARRDPRLVSWIATTAPRCRRVATVCTGAFLAAEAGLLDGKRVTTHWASAERLAAEYPALDVDPDPIYIRDGSCWSSAGVTAGIDLALALVEDDWDVHVAQTVARWLVMFLHRPGGQTQFAAPVWVPRAERSAVRTAQARVEAAPGDDHRIPTMADAAAMSVRHFTRIFAEEVGETPGRFVERVRLEEARRRLETTDETLDVIAARSGLGTAETLRRMFHRRLGVSPDAYRRRFAVGRGERTPA